MLHPLGLLSNLYPLGINPAAVTETTGVIIPVLWPLGVHGNLGPLGLGVQTGAAPIPETVVTAALISPSPTLSAWIRELDEFCIPCVHVYDLQEVLGVHDALESLSTHDALEALSVHDALESLGLHDALEVLSLEDTLEPLSVEGCDC